MHRRATPSSRLATTRATLLAAILSAILAAGLAVLGACATEDTVAVAPGEETEVGLAGESEAEVAARDLSLYWVKHGAEYRALTRQIYGDATQDLPAFLADKGFSALPEQENAADLPPAVILDVDETVVSNVDFQISYERPFENWKLDEFSRTTKAVAVEGVQGFVDAARGLGVEIFFVTNRPCEPRDGGDDPCPQRRTTIEDLAEIGIETDADHVLLSEERGWTREKLTRRLHVAESHRVLMLIGDDYGDFIPCVRATAVAPCTEAATVESRAAALDEYAEYWGHGWYILPNPMHGSWTSVIETP
ncbi:MAG TPA: HAD family acid phosphatase [Woeseiaceae bacterium]|nr:HAD family acid phosphatase [Woeseiaceae bacterium]